MERGKVGQMSGKMGLVDDVAVLLLRVGRRDVGVCLGNHSPPVKHLLATEVCLGGC